MDMQQVVRAAIAFTVVGFGASSAVAGSDEREQHVDEHEQRSSQSAKAIEAGNAAEMVYATRTATEFMAWGTGTMIDAAQRYADRILKLVDANPALGVIRCSGGGFVHIKRVQVRPKSKSQGSNAHGKNRSDNDHDDDHDDQRKTKDIQPQSQQTAAPLYALVISSSACKSQEAGATWVDVESGQSFIQYRQAPNQPMTLVAVRFGSTKHKKFTRKLISVTQNKVLATRQFDYSVRGRLTPSTDDVMYSGGQFRYLVNGTHSDEAALYTASAAPNAVAGSSLIVLRADNLRLNVNYVAGTNTTGFGTNVDRRYVSGVLKYDTDVQYTGGPRRQFSQTLTADKLQHHLKWSTTGTPVHSVRGAMELKFPGYMTGCQAGSYRFRTATPIGPDAINNIPGGKVVINGVNVVKYNADQSVTVASGGLAFHYDLVESGYEGYETLCGFAKTY